MSKSTSESSPSSSEPSAKALPASPTDSKPLETPQTLEEWGEELMPKMDELSKNETLRREIARRLS